MPDLNAAVTEAIFVAERSLDAAIAAWKRVESAEAAIADDETIPGAERAIAQRGVGLARKTLAVLEALRG